MAFNFDSWKKKDDKKRKSLDSQMPSFESFKSSRQTNVPQQKEFVSTFKNYEERKAARELDAQPAKSQKAKDADAARFAGSAMDRSPKSQKAKDADAARFGGGAQRQEEQRQEKVRDVKADRFAARYAPDVEINQPKKTEKAKSADDQRFAQRYSQENQKKVETARKEAMPATKINKPIEVAKTKSVDQKDRYDLGARAGQTGRTTKDKASIVKAAIGGYKAFTDKDNDNDTLSEKFGASVRLGIGDAVESAGDGVNYVAKKTQFGVENKDDMWLKAGQSMQKAGQNFREGFEDTVYDKEFSKESLSDSDWYATSLTRTIPNTLASLAPGLGAAKVLGTVNRIKNMPKIYKTIIQSVGGSGATTAYDSAVLSGGIYEEAKSRGMSEDEAIDAADQAFRRNALLTGGTTALEFGAGLLPFGKGISKLAKAGSIAGRTAGGAGLEAFQEGGQAAIEADALGDDFKWTDPSTIEAMVIGGLMGGTMTGSMATYRALQKDKTQQQNTNQDKPFNETTMEVEQGVERTEKVEDPKESILERVIEELPQERRDELDEGIFKLREEGFTYEDARDAIMETMVEDYPDVESTLADATIKYVKTKQREREVAGLENAPGEDVAARAKSFSPGEQVEFKGQNVTVKDVDGHQVEMETPDGKRFTADANAVNKVVNQEFDPLESDGDKVYEEMQSELAQEPVLEPVTEVVPKAAPKPSPKPKQPKTEPIDVVPGDDVQLQGTSANKGYKVEEVIGDEVKLTTPNNKTITVAKSKIVAKLNQQAQEESFDNEPTFEAAPEMGQSETAGNVELPPGFRNDVRNELNERVNDDGMTIDEAVQAMKEDDYYVDSPEWHGVIEEEAASSFGFKGKVQAAPEQEIIEDEVIAEETPKQELTKETEEPKAPVKPINFKLSKFEPRNSENDGIMGLSSDEGILTVRVMQSTTKEGLAALEELGFRFAKTEKVGTAKYFLFTKPSSGMKDFMETRKALKAYEPTSTIPKVEETTEPEEGQEPVVEKVAQVEISTSDWKPGDKALLGSSNREVTIESIKGTVVKAKNSLGKTVVTSLASLKREATETKVPLSEQGAKAQKEVIKNKVVDIPASLEDNALVNELKERVLAATGVDDVKAWNAVLQEVMQNKGIDPVQETHTLLINETVKKSKSVTNKQKSTKNLYTVKEYKSLDEVVLKDERNDNELTLNRSEIAKYMYFSNESVATIPFENVSLTVAKDGGNGTANKYTVKSKDNTFIVSTLEDKKAKAHAEEAAHRLRHVGRYFQAGYKILGFKIENKLTNSEFEILSVGMTPQGVEYKIKDLTTGHDAWFSPSLEDGQVYDIPMMKETHKKEKVIEKDNEVKEETKVKPLEKHVGDAIDFLETAVNQNGSMTFTKENKEAIHFEGVHGFDNEHNEEVKIQKSDGMIYTRPSSGGDWIESGVAYPPMAKEKESPAPTSDDPKNAKEVIQSFRKKMRDGDYTAKDLQEHFQYVKNNEEEVKAQFMDLLNNSDNWKRRRKDTKEKKVDELYDETLIRPLYGNSDMVSTRLDYFGKSAEERKASEIAQYEKQLSQITDESIAEYLEKQNAERAKEQKALDNPETLEEYRKKASSKDGLSAEEQAKYDELVALKTRELEAKKKTAAPTNSVSKGDYTIEPFKHTKTGEDLWVVKTPKVSKEDYPELARYMKSLGGGYSRFKKGFLFKEDPTAKLDGEISESEVVDLTESNQARISEKLRAVADNMQGTIDNKRNDGRKTNTYKRAREDAHAREEADKMERQQGIMNRVADAIASGEATFLDNVTARTHFNTLDHILWLAKRERLNKKENQNLRPSEREKMEREPITVEEINAMELPKVNIYADDLKRIVKEMDGTKGLMRVLAKLTKEINAANANSNHMIDGEKNREDIMKVVDAAINAGKEIYVAQAIKERYNDLKRLEAMKLNTPALLRSGIREYIRYTEDVGENTEQKEKDRKRKREAELSKMKIAGFFPTPSKIIDRMLGEADIQPGMTVLEPSAGKGNIAERIRSEHADATLDVVEYDYDLNEYLESLGYNVVGKDFMEHTGAYDRIIMNPPFEKGQDIDHVRHAYEMLKPGGRVVAIMSEGPFYRSDKKATSFREWLEENEGQSNKLDEGSFKDSERSTGVNTRMVVLEKPEVSETAKPQKEELTDDMKAMVEYHKYSNHTKEIGSEKWFAISSKYSEVTERLFELPVEKRTKIIEEAKQKALEEPYFPIQSESKKKTSDGNTGEAFTENGTKIEFEYRVVEVADLIASNDSNGKVNPNYPQELQPRDRSRKASQVQIQNIAQKLNPVLVGESSKASDGAPIVGPDMVVESGNGRTIAMMKMYDEEYLNSRDSYLEFLMENAEDFGLDYQVIQDMEEPILVRVRTNDVDRVQFVHEANEASVSAMSAAEQATADVGKMNNKLMTLFTPTENGELNTATNRAFITAFMGDVVAKSERGRYMTSDGQLSQDGLIRVRNAVFAKAYGSIDAISLLAESTDNNIRIVTNAMLQSAPRFAIMKDDIKNGELHDEDITGDIVDAMVKLGELRNEGTSVQTFLDQLTMFDDVSPEAKEMLNIFHDKKFKRSAKALNELFQKYVDVLEVAGSPNQIKLFEEAPPTKAEILAVALKRVNEDVQTSLFETESESGNETRTGNEKNREKPETKTKPRPTYKPIAPDGEITAIGKPIRHVYYSSLTDYKRKVKTDSPNGSIAHADYKLESVHFAPHFKDLPIEDQYISLYHEIGHIVEPRLKYTNYMDFKGEWEAVSRFSRARFWEPYDYTTQLIKDKRIALNKNTPMYKKEEPGVPQNAKYLWFKDYLHRTSEQFADAYSLYENNYEEAVKLMPETVKLLDRYHGNKEPVPYVMVQKNDRVELEVLDNTTKKMVFAKGTVVEINERTNRATVNLDVYDVVFETNISTLKVLDFDPARLNGKVTKKEIVAKNPSETILPPKKRTGETIVNGETPEYDENISVGDEVYFDVGRTRYIGVVLDIPPVDSPRGLSLIDTPSGKRTVMRNKLVKMPQEEPKAKPKKKSNPHEEGFAGLKRKQEDNRRMDGTEEADTTDYEGDVSRTKIIQYINKEFKTTIGQGKLRGKQGVYKNKFSIIRTKEYGQFEVIAHELGHHLDKIARYSSNPKIRAELIKFAKANLDIPASYTNTQIAKEGVAEYYRQVFYNETAANINIKDLSQGLKQEMADGLTKAKLVPQTYELKRMMSMWLNRDAKTELGGVVTRIGNKEKEKISAKRRIDKMYTNWFEEGHPIWRAIKDIEKETGKKIEGKNDAYALYRLTRGTTARAAAFTSGYSFDSDGNKTGESFEDILKEVDDLEEFGQYLVARRGLHLIEKRGKSNTPLSQDLMREHIRVESPKYQALAQRVYDYQDRLMHTTLVEGGLIDPELPEKLRELDPYYVPFYRVMTEDGSVVNKGSGGSGGSIANQQQGIKRMKEEGSARDIINPIESIIKNTHLMFAITDRNSVGVALSELANPNSEFASEVARDIIEEIPNSFTVTDVALDQMKKALIDSGLDEDIMEELDLSQTAKVFNPLFKPNTSQNEILVWKEGKPKLYKVRDDMLYNALVVGDNVLLNKLTGSLLWKGAEASNKVLRWGIVSSPYFTARTFARSLFQMAIKTEATGLNYWTQPFELIKSMWSVVTKDNDMYDWWASGGAQSTFIAVENEYIDKSLNHLALNRKAWDMAKGRYKPKSKAERIEMSKYMAKSVVLSPFNLMSKVNDVLDQSLKLSEYNIMKKQTGDRQKSAIASRDADLDYRRMGAAGIKQYNSINLFFNVSLQGPDNIARTFANHKVRTMVRGFSFLTLPTILLYLSNRDDEEYQELETWEKDMNWVFKLDDGKFLKVPIPFEVGILFKTLPEKIVGEMMDKMKGEDKHTWDNGFNNMAKTMIPSVLPTVAAIFANYKAKKDLTNDRPFVPMGLQSLPAEEQYNEKTSEIMKWAGQVLNMSPMVLQETFNGQFGQMGTLGLFGADSVLSSIGVTEKRIDTKGILMSYSERYVKASVNDGGTASITSFYDKKKKLEEKKADSGIKFYDSPELDSYQQANDDLRVLRKVRQELLSDKLTPGEGLKFTKEEKKYQVDAINNGMRDIARYVQGKEPIDPDSLQEALRIMDEYDAYTKMLDKEARRRAKELKAQDKANGQ